MEPQEENYLTAEIRQRLKVIIKQSSPNFTWKKINGFSDDELTGLSLESLEKLEKKREKERYLTLSLPERVEILYPEFKRMYPETVLSSIPEKDLERIVSGTPVFEVLGRFSTVPKYLLEQLEEVEKQKSRRGSYSRTYKDGKMSSTSVRVGNKGSADRNYNG